MGYGHAEISDLVGKIRTNIAQPLLVAFVNENLLLFDGPFFNTYLKAVNVKTIGESSKKLNKKEIQGRHCRELIQRNYDILTALLDRSPWLGYYRARYTGNTLRYRSG